MADLPNPKNRKELYLYDAATGRTGDLPSPKTREELYLNEIAENGGGSGGTSNYNQLSNKPKINNVELSGNKTLAELGIIDNTVSNLLNYYLKSETYTQAEVNALISAIVTLDIQVVSTLPTEDISTTTIYLVPKADAETDNVYDEYLYVSNAWELIGNTEIDLTGYVTDTELTTALADYTTTANLTTLLANKADASDVDDIEALIPSTATTSNKLATMSDIGTEYPILFDETGTEYKVGWYKRASDGKVKPVWRKDYTKDLVISSGIDYKICEIDTDYKIIKYNATMYIPITNSTYDLAFCVDNGTYAINSQINNGVKEIVLRVRNDTMSNPIDILLSTFFIKISDEWKDVI